MSATRGSLPRLGGATLPALVLALLTLAATLGPRVARPPDVQDLEASLAPPCVAHPFGVDLLGRDLLSRSLHGLGLSLKIGLLATLLATTLGLLVGAVAGFFGGWTDALLMRMVDVLYGLPYIAFVVVMVVVFGRSDTNLLVAIGVTSWLTTARIVRAEVRAVRVRPFIDAARALGASRLRILLVHVIPNVMGTVIVYAAITVPMAIRQEALLSFLGLGVEPPAASLGSLLREGLSALSPLRSTWWLLAFPTLLLVVLVGALSGLADTLRDRFDPRAHPSGR